MYTYRKAVSRREQLASSKELYDLVVDDLATKGKLSEAHWYAKTLYGPFQDDTSLYLAKTRVQKWIGRNRAKLETWVANHLEGSSAERALTSIVGKGRSKTPNTCKDDLLMPPTKSKNVVTYTDDEVPTETLLAEINDAAEEQEKEPVDICAYLDHLAARKDFEENEFPQESKIEIFLKSSRPVPIVFTSDWHLGSIGVDYLQFKADHQFMIAHPELKIITVGDLIDNFVRFRSAEAILQQVCNPRMQHRLLYMIAKNLSETKQFLAATWGNHDVERDEAIIGQSMIAQMLAAHTHFFDGRGMIVLKVGPSLEAAQTYTILLTHTPPGKSQYDKNYGNKRLYREYFPADVTVTAHFHKAAVQQDSHYDAARDAGFNFGGQRVSISTGTYKTKDAYSRRYWTEGKIGAPTVLFWHDTLRMEAFRSAESAIIQLKGLECPSSTPNQPGSKLNDGNAKLKKIAARPKTVKNAGSTKSEKRKTQR